ncbi:hypothetical protein AVEN_26480-1 [Araneus ventricosus]|uniref:Uncharacterized protein n=1 Tax=Araneus ventricosus TaxID=182803 RepID=A0A4Y2CUD3_ARAVE|nr:hypothetical protein AVEN_26480-1 [Araneus ventricosus]
MKTTQQVAPIPYELCLLLPLSKRNPCSAFSIELHSLSPRPHFSFMTQHSEWITNKDENPDFSITPRQLSSDFRTDDGFWSDATEIARRDLTVNVQLYNFCSI